MGWRKQKLLEWSTVEGLYKPELILLPTISKVFVYLVYELEYFAI